MDYVVMIGQFFLSLSILVVLHEFGHFLPARWFGTRVEKFYLFFDPYFSLFKKKIGDTEYGIGWLPLGGYVKISGMIDESMDKEQMEGPPQPWEFRSKKPWQKLIIMLGGVTVNFLLGFLIFGLMLWYWGEEFLPNEQVKQGIYVDALGSQLGLQDGDQIIDIEGKPFERFEGRTIIKEIALNGARDISVMRNGQKTKVTVGEDVVKELTTYKNKSAVIMGARHYTAVKEVTSGMPAEKAGVKVGDRFISLDGTPAEYLHEFMGQFSPEPNVKHSLGVIRGSDTLNLDFTSSKQGRLGVYWVMPQDVFTMERKSYGLMEALPMGVAKGYNFLADQIKAFGKMFSGEIKASESLGGFGTISQLFPKTWDWERFWYITAILSLILGFMNLLPIPALDGGHVMFLLWEVFTGRKVSDKVMEYATIAGFVFVMGLVLYANGLDIWRYFNQ